MANVHPEITPALQAFIEAQPMFFVASAPNATEGHINLSPKGLDSFRVLAKNRVVYADVTGSGNETAAHLAENGRLTIMFCAFQGPPNILRLYGRGKIVKLDDPEALLITPLFYPLPGLRQYVLLEVERVQTSCGFGVPEMAFQNHRDTLLRWATAKGEAGLEAYRAEKNAHSIDGLPSSFA